MSKRSISLREKLGCVLLDVPRLIPALIFKNQWIRVWNRHDSLKVVKGGVETSAIGPWSSDIHACNVYPWVGNRLLKLALDQWPIEFKTKGSNFVKPDISFIIPHRGMERFPLLVRTINTILAQKDIYVECIVLEQDVLQTATNLPTGVKYIHLPHPDDRLGWRKSWAFNVGARYANADILVFHDGDILVPSVYGREILRKMNDLNIEVLHLQRFLFCMNLVETNRILKHKIIALDTIPERVRQNWRGGTVAIRRDAFLRIGGYDERFIDWGGEDNEFYDRCTTLNGWRYGYLPFIHLWHEAQSSKFSSARKCKLKFLRTILEQTSQERITRLKSCQNLPCKT